mmetsp:Transcript_141917/g.353705  ORF Transcript_141917/g.353705 Transcript_141917/m.353705 type:complete len:391 (+) Transcript_141917:402-1574(+)
MDQAVVHFMVGGEPVGDGLHRAHLPLLVARAGRARAILVLVARVVRGAGRQGASDDPLVRVPVELQAAVRAVHSADAPWMKPKIARPLLTIHARRHPRFVLPAVCWMQALAEKLQLALHDAQLLGAERPQNDRKVALPLRQVDEQLPEGWENLMPAKPHDGLLRLVRILGHLFLVQNNFLDVVCLGKQPIVRVGQCLQHLVEKGAKPLAWLIRVSEHGLHALHLLVVGRVDSPEEVGVGTQRGVHCLHGRLWGDKFPTLLECAAPSQLREHAVEFGLCAPVCSHVARHQCARQGEVQDQLAALLGLLARHVQVGEKAVPPHILSNTVAPTLSKHGKTCRCDVITSPKVQPEPPEHHRVGLGKGRKPVVADLGALCEPQVRPLQTHRQPLG